MFREPDTLSILFFTHHLEIVASDNFLIFLTV